MLLVLTGCVNVDKATGQPTGDLVLAGWDLGPVLGEFI